MPYSPGSAGFGIFNMAVEVEQNAFFFLLTSVCVQLFKNYYQLSLFANTYPDEEL